MQVLWQMRPIRLKIDDQKSPIIVMQERLIRLRSGDQMEQRLMGRLREADLSSASGEEDHSREHFDSHWEYFLALLGCLAGFGSFWRFPYLFYKNGGSVFLIPYFLALVLLGAPLLQLQSLLGQASQTTNLRLWERLHPKLRGCGGFAVFVSLAMSAYYNGILTYAFVYLFNSFQSPLPWVRDPDPADPLNQRYFHQQVLHLTTSIDEPGSFQTHIYLFYVFSIGLCIAAIIKGIKVSGKITLVTASLPYFLLFVLLLRGLFLPEAGEAIRYLLRPDLSRLLSLTIWKDAAIQVFFQLSVGTAAPMMYASFRSKHQPLGNTTWHICLGIAVCGMISVLIVYIYIFHFIGQSGLAFQQLILSGPTLAFVVFSQALALLPMQNLWAILFYTTLVLLGIDSQFGLMESFCASLQDTQFARTLNDPFAVRKGMGVCLCAAGLLFSWGNGYYMIMFLDQFTCSVPIPLGCLLQAYVFGLQLDFQQLQRKQLALTGEGSPPVLVSIIESKWLCGMLAFILGIGLLDQVGYCWSLPFMLSVGGWCLTLAPCLYAGAYWLWVQAQLEPSELEMAAIFKDGHRAKQIQLTDP